MYKAAHSIQGRLNDVNLLLATFATRNEDDGQYTPEAEAVLDSVASYTRLFHAFNWAKHASAFNVLLSPRGMSRMLSRGLMTQSEFNALQAIDQKAGAQNAQWMFRVDYYQVPQRHGGWGHQGRCGHETCISRQDYYFERQIRWNRRFA